MKNRQLVMDMAQICINEAEFSIRNIPQILNITRLRIQLKHELFTIYNNLPDLSVAMSSKLTVSDLLTRNKVIAAKHEPFPSMADRVAMGIGPAHIAVVTCADPRCDPSYYLDLKWTDGVVVFRNVNGHITPLLADIIAIDAYLQLDHIMIVHHTDCGATHFTNEMIRANLKKRYPDDENIDSMTFGAVSTIEQSIKDDLAVLKAAPYIRKELVEGSAGFLYDLKTGLLTPVA